MATNKKNIKVRDLKPKKDAKGGGYTPPTNPLGGGGSTAPSGGGGSTAPSGGGGITSDN